MRIDRFLSKNRILDLKSRELPLALDELLAVALPAGTTRVKAAPKFFSTQAQIAAGTLAAASSAETNAASSRTKDASGGNGASCDGATDASSTSA